MKSFEFGKKSYKYDPTKILVSDEYSKTYLGRSLSNGQIVAIKIISNINDAHIMGIYEEEIKIMKKLAKLQPNLKKFFIELYDYRIDKKNNSITMIIEYFNLFNLQKYIDLNKELNQNGALKLISQIAYALKILNSLDLNHANLTPSNIMLNKDEKTNIIQIKLMNFLCLTQINEKISITTKNDTRAPLINNNNPMNVGKTPQYNLLPHLTNNKASDYTFKSDIWWSLGIILYQMLYNKLPWQISTHENEYQDIKTNKESKICFPKNSNCISNECKEFIEKCLQIHEKERLSWKTLLEYKLLQSYFADIEQYNNDEKELSSPEVNQNPIKFNNLDVPSSFREENPKNNNKNITKSDEVYIPSIDEINEDHNKKYPFSITYDKDSKEEIVENHVKETKCNNITSFDLQNEIMFQSQSKDPNPNDNGLQENRKKSFYRGEYCPIPHMSTINNKQKQNTKITDFYNKDSNHDGIMTGDCKVCLIF